MEKVRDLSLEEQEGRRLFRKGTRKGFPAEDFGNGKGGSINISNSWEVAIIYNR